jgi:UDPglucose 6-dehydrogenase
MKMTVVGLGKLGAPLAACLASKGHEVVGVDVDPAKVAALNEGRAPVAETGLGEMIGAHRARLRATGDLAAGARDADAIFIVVATPSEPDGSFSLRYVLPACETIGGALRTHAGRPLIVLTSTVLPGSTGGPVLAALERSSGRRVGQGFGLCYSPEFIALGSVIRDFLNPDFVLIGESDAQSGAQLEGIYKVVCDNAPAAARMNFVNAELTKISLNTFVTTKIAFANMIARMCERLPGGDVDVVTNAIGLDTRIGRKYLKGAVSYGGPCFPRDNRALAALARRVGASASLAEATDQANQGHVRSLAEAVKARLKAGGTVGILGLSYKPNTDVAEQSPGLLLAQALAAEGVALALHDPAALPNALRALAGTKAAACETVEECVRRSDVLALVTPWEAYRQITPALLARPGEPRVLIDCWRVLGSPAMRAAVTYVALGQGTES